VTLPRFVDSPDVGQKGSIGLLARTFRSGRPCIVSRRSDAATPSDRAPAFVAWTPGADRSLDADPAAL